MEGWIKLHRGLLEWEWYDEPNVFRLFLHCLLKANHSDKSWRGTTIKRGEFVTSLQNLSSETKLSVQQVRTCLKKLTNELTIKSTSQHTVIQVVKYNEYQDDNKQSNKQVTNEQQTNNKQITTTKNDNNNNNINLLSDEVICYLNQKLNRSFKTTETVKKMIGARNKDGYELDDFKKVIDSKYREWIGDEAMKKYLRPSTLFGTKFYEYHGAIATDKKEFDIVEYYKLSPEEKRKVRKSMDINPNPAF
jgi:uncharacterized phage protein (TIGR02220 family)